MHYEKLGHRLKLIAPKYRPDPVHRLEDIPEKVYSTELKPIVVVKTAQFSLLVSLHHPYKVVLGKDSLPSKTYRNPHQCD